MIEEICREATNSQQQQQIHTAQFETSARIPQCSLVTFNSKWLLLQPLKVEILNVDPFIVIYHRAMSGKQLDDLKQFIVEKEEDSLADDDGMLQLTNIGLKKMHQLNEKLHRVIGHERDTLNAKSWRFDFYNFENIMEVEKTSVQKAAGNTKQAGVMFNVNIEEVMVVVKQVRLNFRLLFAVTRTKNGWLSSISPASIECKSTQGICALLVNFK